MNTTPEQPAQNEEPGQMIDITPFQPAPEEVKPWRPPESWLSSKHWRDQLPDLTRGEQVEFQAMGFVIKSEFVPALADRIAQRDRFPVTDYEDPIPGREGEFPDQYWGRAASGTYLRVGIFYQDQQIWGYDAVTVKNDYNSLEAVAANAIAFYFSGFGLTNDTRDLAMALGTV